MDWQIGPVKAEEKGQSCRHGQETTLRHIKMVCRSCGMG